jgi:predicted RNase H-like nuclease (RuvC/YqgF family)
MTTKEFEAIKNKIENAKREKARAEGVMARIQDQWKKEYKLDGVSAVEAHIKQLENELKRDQEKLAALYEQLEAVVDWDSV